MVYKKICLLFLITMITFSCVTNPVRETETIAPEKSLYELNIRDAETGNVEAQINIGISYENGYGVPANFDEAYLWYRKAAAKGNNEAYYRIGTFYEFGYAVEQNGDSALEWYLSSAYTGYLPAIGKMIKFNEDEIEEQLKWIKKGMEFDDPYSFFRYGLILEETDPVKALEYFIKSKTSEDLIARGVLSILSLSDQYPFFNNKMSIQNIQIAADAGHNRSQVFLGWLYEFGIEVDQNRAKAFGLYKDASESDEILALYNLSRFYGKGIFVNADPHLSKLFFKQISQTYYSPVLSDLMTYATNKGLEEQLRVLYRFLSSKNDTNAMYHLGLLSDRSEGFKWFWLAAENGHSDAMIELAKAYLTAGTSEYNPVQAAVWLMIAENKTGIVKEDFSSSELLDLMTEDEKMEVSRLFTEIYYSEGVEQNTDFIR